MSPCLFLIYNATFIQFLSLFRVSGAHFPMHIVLAISMAVNIIFDLNSLKVEIISLSKPLTRFGKRSIVFPIRGYVPLAGNDGGEAKTTRC